jgi:hypothetical protein
MIGEYLTEVFYLENEPIEWSAPQTWSVSIPVSKPESQTGVSTRSLNQESQPGVSTMSSNEVKPPPPPPSPPKHPIPTNVFKTMIPSSAANPTNRRKSPKSPIYQYTISLQRLDPPNRRWREVVGFRLVISEERMIGDDANGEEPTDTADAPDAPNTDEELNDDPTQ